MANYPGAIDGAASLMAMMYGMHAAGLWRDTRGENRLDSGTPWYDVYETADGQWISIGSNEPQFYEALLDRLLHHSHTLMIQGDSYRLRQKRKAGVLGTSGKN